MSRATLESVERRQIGKSEARRLRQEGKVPATVYGKGIEAINVVVDAGPLQRLIQSQGLGRLIDLKVGGKGHVVLLRHVQRDPVQGTIQHVDFHAVPLAEEVRVTVPIVVTGEEVRGNDGGVVTQSLREVEVTCLPTAIPDSINVDVSNLSAGDSVTLGELAFPEGVTPSAAPEEVVVSITVPRVAADQADEAAEPAEGEEAADARASDAQAADGDQPAEGGGADEA